MNALFAITVGCTEPPIQHKRGDAFRLTESLSAPTLIMGSGSELCTETPQSEARLQTSKNGGELPCSFPAIMSLR